MKRWASTGRRGFLNGAAAFALLLPAKTGYAKGTKRKGLWPRIAPPRPPRISHVIEQLGRRRDDFYSWMKFVPKTGERTIATLPARIGTMLARENAYAEAMLAPLDGLRAELSAAMLARAVEDAAPPASARDGWVYSSAMPATGRHYVHSRRRSDGGPTELLVDDAERARGQAYFRSTDHQPSPDHRWFVWAEDVIGNDRHRIMVRDSTSGEVRTLVAKDAYGYGALAFAPSSRWLFWIWRDARNRPTRLYRTALDGGATELVYEEKDPAIFLSLKRTAAGGYIALNLSGSDTSEVRLIAAGRETDDPVTVWPRRAGVRYEIDEWDGALVALTDADGAIDMALLRLDPRDFHVVETLVPHRPGVPVLSIAPFAAALVRLERVDGLHRIAILRRDGSEHVVSFPEQAYALELPTDQAYEAGAVLIGHQSPKSPLRWIAVDIDTGSQNVVRQQRVAHFDPDRYDVQRVFARADDGEMVPITVLSLKGAPKDGSTPLLQYGYGAYGISADPLFSVPALALVDRGWRYAIAHVRGGSERGRRWFLEGRRFSKRNSFTDFIACAEHLCAQGYATKGRVIAHGLSAGGLLVGASMNIKPSLWGGVIAQVPFVDMLNTMSDADHPLVPLFRPDWGDPLADPEAYDYIASISPYENVRPAPYPPLLCTAGLKDDRVAYWEPAKLVAQVRHASTSGNPAMLLTDMHSGHQKSADLGKQYDEQALFWAFAIRCLG